MVASPLSPGMLLETYGVGAASLSVPFSLAQYSYALPDRCHSHVPQGGLRTRLRARTRSPAFAAARHAAWCGARMPGRRVVC